MAETTLIAWTDHTFNPWLGCTKVSEGCRHCYAETLTKNRMGLKLWGVKAPRQETKTPWQHVRQWERLAAEGLCPKCRNGADVRKCAYCNRTGYAPGNYGTAEQPCGKCTTVAECDSCGGDGVFTTTPHLVFTGSLMDWAEDRKDLVPIRQRMWEVIRSSPNLWFQMLTKRPENIPNVLPADWGDGYPNVWLGSTIEDNRVKHRADALRAVTARYRFISYEPAIGPANDVDLTGIDWVIYGGESGPGYRPHRMQWARDMRNRCVGGHRQPGAEGSWPDYSVSSGRPASANALAFFMKQDAAHRTEINPFLVEEDGSKWAYKQYPGKLNPPMRIGA